MGARKRRTIERAVAARNKYLLRLVVASYRAYIQVVNAEAEVADDTYGAGHDEQLPAVVRLLRACVPACVPGCVPACVPA